MLDLRWLYCLLLLAAPLWLIADTDSTSSHTNKQIVVLTIDGPIGPATSDYVQRGLLTAMDMNAELIVLKIDTPGGLDTAMRDIIQGIISSPIPVVGYVAPSGARAASAGTYILYATHIAAMAPATTLGAATPIQIGGTPGMPEAPDKPFKKPPVNDQEKDQDQDAEQETQDEKPTPDAMKKKIINDAAAYIRGLAQMRGRNAEWAEQAVREAASLSAEEAVEMNVANLVAADFNDLLTKLDGQAINILGQERTITTTNTITEYLEPDWRNRLLSIITDPNILPILMTLGMFGLIYEMLHPGFVLPGVLGGICLLLALYAAQVLPVNYAGIALILLGIAFMVGEVFMPSFGALGIGGVIAFVIGSIILIDTDLEGYGVSLPFIIAVGIMNAGLFIGIMMLAMKARNRPVVSGHEELIGSVGEALEAFEASGRVRVHSEDWQAHTRFPIKQGQKIRVTGIEGLTLIVEAANHTEQRL